MTTLTNSIAKRFWRFIANHHRLWQWWQRRGVGEFAVRQRYFVMQKRVRWKCRHVLSSRRVIDGPLAGTIYASDQAIGSSYWPKLLGTYERELHGHIEDICTRGYRKIFDIGYAEGFYLIGLGRRCRHAKLIGYDIESSAETLCRSNAEVNDISEDRLDLRGEFEPKQFMNDVDEGSLVVVDCEGFEDQVLQGIDETTLSRADWLIEMHDHLAPGTTERWKQALIRTHEVVQIQTQPDLDQRSAHLPVELRDRCDEFERRTLVDEGRLADQSWIVATRRTAA